MAFGLDELRERERQAQMRNNVRDELQTTINEAAKQQMELFKTTLEKFAIDHKRELKEDPEFRAAFNNMCRQIGVDPLQSTKGFWSSVLGVGDFYNELSIKVIYVCLKQKKSNGGLLELSNVLEQVRATYKGQKVPALNEKDIECSLRNLKCLGSGYYIVELGKKLYLKTTSFDLDQDHATVLSLAEGTGYFTENNNLGWPQKRFQIAVDSLLEQGFIWVDDFRGVKSYYVLAMFKGFSGGN